MRFALLALSVLAILGCGTVEYDSPNAPPPTLAVKTGSWSEFEVGGAIFTVTRRNDTDGEVKALNRNANRAMIKVVEHEPSLLCANCPTVPDSIIIDSLALGSGKEVTNYLRFDQFMLITFTVKVWKDDIVDFFGSCGYQDGSWKSSCFLSESEATIEIKQ